LLAEIVRAASTRDKIKFVIVGGGVEHPKLEALLAGCSNVRLVGWLEDMAAVWSAADIALLTSRNEGTPSSLIEAMAAEKPLVTTPAGGVKDLLFGGEQSERGHLKQYSNGFMFTSAEAAVNAIDRLSVSPELRQSMGKQGRAFALKNYSGERLVEDMRKMYYRLAGRGIDGDARRSALSQTV
jgi:glycosyltransferase involved in cell wall biosynthesis